MRPPRVVFALVLATLCALGTASSVSAQSLGVVTAERAVIWRADSSVVATVAGAGVVLELTARSERWYEVIIPASLGGRGERGLIAIGQVKLADGAAPPPERPLRGSEPQAGSPRRPPPAPPRSPLPPQPPMSLRAFGQGGLIGFTARESFAAVVGRSYGYSFGAGVQLRFGSGVYVQTSLEQFRRTGQRVYVFDGESFPLGIDNTVTLQPAVVAVGYRPPSAASVRPYLGAGLGAYRLREVSPFDGADESVDQWRRGYHAHIGFELRPRGWVTPALEARYTTVPKGLGDAGAAALLKQTDLGGWQIHAKVLVGR